MVDLRVIEGGDRGRSTVRAAEVVDLDDVRDRLDAFVEGARASIVRDLRPDFVAVAEKVYLAIDDLAEVAARGRR